MASIGQITGEIILKADNFFRAMDQVEKSTEQVKNKTEGLNTGMLNAATTLNVLETGYRYTSQALNMYTNATVNAYKEATEFSRLTGMNINQAGKWKEVMEQNGMELGTLTYAYKAFANNLYSAQTGGEAALKAFAALHVQVKDTKGAVRDSNTVFLEALAALEKMPDGAKKAALAQDIMGRGAININKLYAQGTTAIKDYTEAQSNLSDKGAKATDDYNKAIAKLNSSMEDFTVTTGERLVPALTLLVNFLKDGVMPAINWILGGFEIAGKGAARIGIAITTAIYDANDAIANTFVGKQMGVQFANRINLTNYQAMLEGTFKGVNEKSPAAPGTGNDIQDKLNNLKTSITGSTDATTKQKDATEGSTETTKSNTTALDQLSKITWEAYDKFKSGKLTQQEYNEIVKQTIEIQKQLNAQLVTSAAQNAPSSSYNKIISQALAGKSGKELQEAVAKLYARSDINEILGGRTLTASEIGDYASGKTGPSGSGATQTFNNNFAALQQQAIAEGKGNPNYEMKVNNPDGTSFYIDAHGNVAGGIVSPGTGSGPNSQGIYTDVNSQAGANLGNVSAAQIKKNEIALYGEAVMSLSPNAGMVPGFDKNGNVIGYFIPFTDGYISMEDYIKAQQYPDYYKYGAALMVPGSVARAQGVLSYPLPGTRPGFASGGIVTRPTLATIGESGAEAIVPLSGTQGFGAGNVVVQINIDGNQVGEAIIDKLSLLGVKTG